MTRGFFLYEFAFASQLARRLCRQRCVTLRKISALPIHLGVFRLTKGYNNDDFFKSEVTNKVILSSCTNTDDQSIVSFI